MAFSTPFFNATGRVQQPSAPAQPQYIQNFSSGGLMNPTRSSGTVLGTSTNRSVSSGGSSGGNSGGGSQPTYNAPSQQDNGLSDMYGALRNEISSGWDNYINSLNQQLEGLNPQREAQEQIATSQYNQGVNTLGLQKTQGMQSLESERGKLEKNQTKTLRDLSGNLKNAFMAGNVYLGARGAGDSSAADQYSMALTKEGTRQRGDVMSQTSDQLQEINTRGENLTNIYNTEVNNLEQIKNSKVAEIAQWFANAQNQIRQAQASGQLSKSQDLASLSKDILNQAISQMNTINQEVSNRRSALESWAIGQSQNIQQLKSNLQNVSNFSASLPQAQQIAGTPNVDSGGNIRVATGTGMYSDEERKRLLGLA